MGVVAVGPCTGSDERDEPARHQSSHGEAFSRARYLHQVLGLLGADGYDEPPAYYELVYELSRELGSPRSNDDRVVWGSGSPSELGGRLVYDNVGVA